MKNKKKLKLKPALELLQEVTTMTNDEFKIQPQDGKDRIIFLFMYNDIDWNQKNNEEMCRRNSSRVSAYANDFPTGNWTFLGLGDEEKWYGTLSLTNQRENGIALQNC